MSHNTDSALIHYPLNAAFDRPIPKSKIYEHSGARTRLKELFVQQVEQIVWQFKLAPETVNLPSKPGVPELQVFSIHLKMPELDHEVLRCIDGAVPFPILFELCFDDQIQVVACYKRPNESDPSKWVISDYFASQWLDARAPRAAMPMALDIGALYEQILRRLIPLPSRPCESLTEQMERIGQIRTKQREVDKTAAKLAKEKQFNRKVDLNGQLRQLKNELEQLSR